MKRTVKLLAAGLVLATAPTTNSLTGSSFVPVAESQALAQSAGPLTQAGFQAWLPQLRALALARGIRQDIVERVFANLEFSARTVELDRQQPGGTGGTSANPPFQPYLARQINAALIARARAHYDENAGRLAAIRARFGVTPSILVAIWGKETNFGTYTGNFDLLNSLASLAYEGRRRALFTDEFIATLRLMERGFPRSVLHGSWAGATGQSQFLPSVYLRLGVDADGDGRPDIWNSAADTLASIANYFRDAGWRPGLPWGSPATVPAGLDRARLASPLHPARCARVYERLSRWLTVAEWRQLGVIPHHALPDSALASLIEPDGPGAPAYLLTQNYRVILDYNCSNYYALTVALLADSIGR